MSVHLSRPAPKSNNQPDDQEDGLADWAATRATKEACFLGTFRDNLMSLWDAQSAWRYVLGAVSAQ